jgi:hypothetical protein
MRPVLNVTFGLSSTLITAVLPFWFFPVRRLLYHVFIDHESFFAGNYFDLCRTSLLKRLLILLVD